MNLPVIQAEESPVSAAKPAALKPVLKKRPKTDVVGLGLGLCGVEGVPAVRLRKAKDGSLEILAADILDLPNKFPADPATAEADMTRWTLPHPFQAPHAAFAVFSPLSTLRHTEEGLEEKPAADKPGAEKAKEDLRRISQETAKGVPPLVATLPEYQAAWAARLLPEGHRPTACSIQLAGTATINGLMSLLKNENAIAFLVFPTATALAAFQEGQLVFYREYSGGQNEIRETLMARMSIDASMADNVMNDNMVDPTPLIEPILRPLFRQADIATDYLQRRRNCSINRFVVYGLPVGQRYWSAIFESMMGQPLAPIAVDASGLKWAAKPLMKMPQDFQANLPLFAAEIGAARAVLEDE